MLELLDKMEKDQGSAETTVAHTTVAQHGLVVGTGDRPNSSLALEDLLCDGPKSGKTGQDQYAALNQHGADTWDLFGQGKRSVVSTDHIDTTVSVGEKRKLATPPLQMTALSPKSPVVSKLPHPTSKSRDTSLQPTTRLATAQASRQLEQQQSKRGGGELELRDAELRLEDFF
jgi:hypothetical protein